MQITGARIVNRELVLTVPMEQAQHFLNEFREGEYDIKRKRKRRTMSQNAYAWVLIDKIAAKMSLGKRCIYRGAIRDIGGVSEVISIKDEAVPKFCQSWENRGEGWPTEILGSHNGWTDIMVYYGSSEYDTKQMAALIDSLIQDAKALDIETMTPAELARLE